MALWVRLHKVTSSFPEEEKYGLTSQVRRAACSVPANIAEGYGKGTNAAFSLSVRHARGSLYELRTLVEGAARLGYIEETNAAEIKQELVELSKMVESFLRSLERTVVREEPFEYETTEE